MFNSFNEICQIDDWLQTVFTLCKKLNAKRYSKCRFLSIMSRVQSVYLHCQWMDKKKKDLDKSQYVKKNLGSQEAIFA